MNPLIHSKNSTILPLLIALAFACFALSLTAQAVVPAPDGSYPGGNTAEGQNALFSLTTGGFKHRGWFLIAQEQHHQQLQHGHWCWDASCQHSRPKYCHRRWSAFKQHHWRQQHCNWSVPPFRNTEGSYNTAAGDQALFSNTTGTVNTAIGAGALTNNNTRARNTAIGGDFVLFSNTTGSLNTAIGVDSLAFNTTGADNTANGAFALDSNTTGAQNTAVGYAALAANTTAGANTSGANTAVGAFAPQSNTTSGANTAIGYAALGNIITNGGNTALGDVAGFNLTGSQNTCIGAGVGGISGENNTIRIADNLSDTQGNSACYIGGIYNQLIDPATDTVVNIDANGKLGTVASSRRFKRD